MYEQWTQLAGGYSVLEAPAVDDGSVFFSDVTAGGVYRLDVAAGGVEVVVPRRRGVGGIALHQAGGIVITGRDVRHVGGPEPDRVLLAAGDVPTPDGASTSFNDFAVGPAGELYVGTVRTSTGHVRAEDELVGPGDSVLVDRPGVATVLVEAIGSTNGAARTTTHLLQVDSANRRVIKLENATGRAGSFSTAAIDGIPDGVALDRDGNLWIAFYGGGCVAAFDLSGTLLDTLKLPCLGVTSLCFGAAEPVMYVTTGAHPDEPSKSGGLYVAPVPVPGAPISAVTI